jgi:hypothetical protein
MSVAQQWLPPFGTADIGRSLSFSRQRETKRTRADMAGWMTCFLILVSYGGPNRKHPNIWKFLRILSSWPRGPVHELCSSAQTPGFWTRIPLEAWMFLCVYSVSVLSFAGNSLATGWSPAQGVLPIVKQRPSFVMDFRALSAVVFLPATLTVMCEVLVLSLWMRLHLSFPVFL